MGRERRSAERLGIVLEMSSQGDTSLRADREGCLRVVRNLLGNAIAHSPGGGVVRILLEGLPGSVRITVDDEGSGVAPELEGQVFEPFVSGPPEPGRRRGYGLGLSICRSVMEDHRGSIRFERREPRGTRFIAEFPRRGDLREMQA
jgi:signal transduction histidine kinase